MKTLNIFILGLLVSLGACSKRSSSNSADTIPYQQPQYSPPNYNWNSYTPGYVPQGNCGSVSTLPSTCYGTYNGYSYCNNLWYYNWNNTYWTFPAFGSCGGNGGSNHDDDWWDDDSSSDDDDWDSCDSDDDCDHHDDDDDHNHGSSYNSGWTKVWGTMGSSENRAITVKVPKNGTYYVSFKGNYSGKKQDEEKLQVKFAGSNTHKIKDLDNSYTGSGEVTRNCKVNVNFKLQGGVTYKIYLSGDEDSVNNTHLRITNYWPSDISKLCN
jgi:hypothetical protein